MQKAGCGAGAGFRRRVWWATGAAGCLRELVDWPARPLARTAGHRVVEDGHRCRTPDVRRRRPAGPGSGGRRAPPAAGGVAGSGKTMLAMRLPGLLPPLTRTVAGHHHGPFGGGGAVAGGWSARRARSGAAPPSSMVSLVGGGTALRPGDQPQPRWRAVHELGEFARRCWMAAPAPRGRGHPPGQGVSRHPAGQLPAHRCHHPCPCGGGPPGQ